jgi:hypothetical protein
MHRWLFVGTLLLLGVSASLRPGVGNAGPPLDPGTCNGLEPTIVGLAGIDEVVHGTGGSDVIVVVDVLKKAGNGIYGATVYGYGGSDTICVEAADVTVFGGSGDDWIDGTGPDGFCDFPGLAGLSNGLAKRQKGVFGEGLYGESGHDTITCGPLIDGGTGNDYVSYAFELYGGPGNDTLEVAFYCDGGSGTDTGIDCDTRVRIEKVVNTPD